MRILMMSETNNSKQERINLRMQHNVKVALERAASFEGETVSHFILSAALAQAEKTIHEHETMHLNLSDAELFYNALAKPPKFNKKLSSALEEHSRRVTDK